MTIEEQRCPHFGIRRTARLGEWGHFCFNCRRQWDGVRSVVDPRLAQVTGPAAASPFDQHQIHRLELYRAAVRAGLYSDWAPLDPEPFFSGRTLPYTTA